jgi:hydroxyquinol 1,2-dioxygenase
MRNIDATTITPAFLQRLNDCADPRLKQVLTSLVTHLHDFAREVKLTEAEWMQGVQFLTATGQMCNDARQEFILLSDTLGLSMLVVALNQAKPPGATEATVFGPFHVDDAPVAAQGADIAGGAPGTPLFVNARLLDLQGQPVANAEVDVWQADDDGLYDVQRPELGSTRRARRAAHRCRRPRALPQHHTHCLPRAHRRPGRAVAAGQRAAPLAAGAPALHDPRRGLRDTDHAYLPRPRPVP